MGMYYLLFRRNGGGVKEASWAFSESTGRSAGALRGNARLKLKGWGGKTGGGNRNTSQDDGLDGR